MRPTGCRGEGQRRRGRADGDTIAGDVLADGDGENEIGGDVGRPRLD
jgi:hypothetical protein